MAGVLIADEMGLGKTVQAIAILESSESYPALVVCPASLRSNWAREATAWIPHRSVEVLSGRNPHSKPNPPADVTILNYDILDAWADDLPALKAIVLDESHYIKNGATKRTKAAIRLSDRQPHDIVRLCLSGTPIVNNPTEILTQLRFLHRHTDFGGVAGFKRRYGAGANLDELNRRLRACCMVRRRKIDVLSELPPKRWATLLFDGDPHRMASYRIAEQDIITHLVTQARDAAEKAGASSEEAWRVAWERAARVGAAQQLVAINVLRRLATEAKMGAVCGWLEDFLVDGRKIVVFAHHRHTIATLASRFPDAVTITGDTSMSDRQENVERFQTDPSCRTMLCSLKAAGVGLTLTAASDVLFVEQGWTPADMDQAADRCHRIGQTDSVTAWVALCADTIDERIAGLIAMKRMTVDAATDGSVLPDLIVELAEQGLVGLGDKISSV